MLHFGLTILLHLIMKNPESHYKLLWKLYEVLFIILIHLLLYMLKYNFYNLMSYFIFIIHFIFVLLLLKCLIWGKTLMFVVWFSNLWNLTYFYLQYFAI